MSVIAGRGQKWWCPHIGGFGPPFTCAVCNGSSERGDTSVPVLALKAVPRENTPQEQFRRGILGAVRAAVKLYPQDVVEIVRQEVLDKRT
jgi:hypothetical protein